MLESDAEAKRAAAALPRRWARRLDWVRRRRASQESIALAPGERVVIFGDVHLDAARGVRRRAFFEFLDAVEPSRTAALVCLGDLFEYYLGPSHLRGTHADVADALAAVVARGVPVTVVPGNRDFLIGREFHAHGVAVAAHGLRLRLTAAARGDNADARHAGAAELWIVHGDELSLSDSIHLAWSRLARGPLARTAARLMPVRLLEAVARGLRRHSRWRHERRVPPAGAGIDPRRRVDGTVAAAMLAVMADDMSERSANWLITGHFHVPLREQHPAGTLMTVGDWDHDGGTVAVFERPGDEPTIAAGLIHSSTLADRSAPPA